MKWFFVLAGAAVLAGCQTSENYAEREDALQAEIAARQGAEVNQICFMRNINGWRELGDNALLVREGIDDWYKLDLAGTCDPEWAFNAISIETRPAASSCLTRGDHISTPDASFTGRCVITGIHEWNADAEVPREREY